MMIGFAVGSPRQEIKIKQNGEWIRSGWWLTSLRPVPPFTNMFDFYPSMDK